MYRRGGGGVVESIIIGANVLVLSRFDLQTDCFGISLGSKHDKIIKPFGRDRFKKRSSLPSCMKTSGKMSRS